MTRHRLLLRGLQWLQRVGPAQDAIAGDLEEELHRGRPSSWVWRQLLYALCAALARRLWSDRRALLERGLLGAGLIVLLAFAATVSAQLASRILAMSAPAWRVDITTTIVAWSAIVTAMCTTAFVCGCWLRRLHQGHRAGAIAGSALLAATSAFVSLRLGPFPEAQTLSPQPAQIVAALCTLIALFASAMHETRATRPRREVRS